METENAINFPPEVVIALNRATNGNGWQYGVGDTVDCAVRAIGEISRLAEIGRLVEQKFRSGNSVPVSRVTIDREEVASCLNG